MTDGRHTKPDISIVLPTFNERNNVRPMVAEIEIAFAPTDLQYEIVFVDDSSDDTPEVIQDMQRTKPYITLIHRSESERTGLGTAIFAGIEAARSDIVCSMDSDLQHPPAVVPTMYKEMQAEGKNFVVASRMVADGSSKGLANMYRHVVSRASRRLAWFVLPRTQKTTDPMTGFFMLDRRILAGATINPIGYKLLVEILARVPAVDSLDVPFVMRKREFDDSKATLKEGLRYLQHLYKLALETKSFTMARFVSPVEWLYDNATTIILASLTAYLLFLLFGAIPSWTVGVLVSVSLFLSFQGMYALFLMLYAWEDPERAAEDRSPENFFDPAISFTTLLPVRHETEVVADTLKAVTNINYPHHLTEVKVICSDEDTETIAAVRDAITAQEVSDRVSLVIYDHTHGTSKPKAMNAALEESNMDVVVIFDAEDEPHKDIFNIVNTVMQRDKVDVVQSGVQLMNYRSNWFSMFNVMEYYFWFKSSLHFYARAGVIPLGGNTVFFKRAHLERVGGWDEQCLTEDGDVGLRLSKIGAKIKVVYDEQHVTQEETPPTLMSFIKQRTRWNQGFLQILLKGEWLGLPKIHQKLLAFYVFTWPIVNAALLLYVPISLYLALTTKMPVFYAMLTNLPLYIVALHFLTFNIGLYYFTQDYKLKYPLWFPLKALVLYYPYQLVLGYGAIRAVYRLTVGNLTWEKTEHTNAHRQMAEAAAERVGLAPIQETV